MELEKKKSSHCSLIRNQLLYNYFEHISNLQESQLTCLVSPQDSVLYLVIHYTRNPWACHSHSVTLSLPFPITVTYYCNNLNFVEQRWQISIFSNCTKSIPIIFKDVITVNYNIPSPDILSPSISMPFTVIILLP